MNPRLWRFNKFFAVSVSHMLQNSSKRKWNSNRTRSLNAICTRAHAALRGAWKFIHNKPERITRWVRCKLWKKVNEVVSRLTARKFIADSWTCIHESFEGSLKKIWHFESLNSAPKVKWILGCCRKHPSWLSLFTSEYFVFSVRISQYITTFSFPLWLYNVNGLWEMLIPRRV